MKFRRSKLVGRTAALIVIAVVAYFFYSSLQKNWASVQQIDFRLNWFVFAAIALFVSAVVVSGWLWGLVLNALTRGSAYRASVREAVRVHSASWLLKYIPGQAGSLVNKVVWANARGISKKIAITSFLYENIFLIIASFIAGIPLLFEINRNTAIVQNQKYVIVGLIVLVSGVVLTSTKSLQKLLGRLLRRFGTTPVTEELFLSHWQSVRFQLLYVLPRILNGIGAIFVALSFMSIPVEAYVPIASAYVVAAAMGMLALFVPSGIGVRESIFVLLVGGVLPTEQAIVIAIVARFYSTIADLGLALLYLLLRSHRKAST